MNEEELRQKRIKNLNKLSNALLIELILEREDYIKNLEIKLGLIKNINEFKKEFKSPLNEEYFGSKLLGDSIL